MILIVFGIGGVELESVLEKEYSNLFLFPISGIAYIFGILIDRTGYQLLRKREGKNMAMVFENQNDKHEQVTIQQMIIFIAHSSERLSSKIDYNRSRLRLCRSWILNFLLITISIIVYLICIKTKHSGTLVVVSVVSLILCISSYAIWSILSKDYYINIISSYNNLKAMEANNKKV